MNDSILITRSTTTDVTMLWTICRQSYSESFAHHWNEGGLEWYLDKVYNLDVMAKELTNPHIYYFVAFVNEQPAGFMKVNAQAELSDYEAVNGMEIEKIYLRPQFQGMGIGRRLITHVLSLQKEPSKKYTWLGVIDTNEAAIQFYIKSGFVIHDKIRLDIPYFKEELKMFRMVSV